MKINLVWDASSTTATAAFRSAVQQAANDLSLLIQNNITANIQVGIDSINGQPMGGAYAEGGPQSVLDSYAQLVTQLSHTDTLNGLPTLSSYYPTTDPSGGNLTISNALAKAFGMLAANASGIDGITGFSSQVMLSSYADMVDTALHELAHALGRINGSSVGSGNWYTPLSLYTYAAPGVLWNPQSATPGYFSTNGGSTNLGVFSTTDYGDFANLQDPFGNYANPTATLTPLDQTVLMALGFTLAAPVSISVPSFLALNLSGSTPSGSYAISGTAATVSANLDALQSQVNYIFGITLTDNAPLFITGTQLQNDASTLSLIQGNFVLTVTGVSAANLGSVLQNTLVTFVSISDIANNITSYLDYLQSNAAKIASINLTDNSPLSLSANQLVSDAAALALLQGNYSITVYSASANQVATILANTHVSSLSISDSASNVSAQLDSLEKNIQAISGITLTDSAPIALTGVQLTTDANVLGKISGYYSLSVSDVSAADVSQVINQGHVAFLSVVDSTNNLTNNFQSLLEHTHQISAITLTDPSPVTLNVHLWNIASTLFGKLTNVPLMQFQDATSQLNGLSLSPLANVHTEVSPTTLDANATITGGIVSLLNLQNLGDTTYIVAAQPNGTAVTISANRIQDTITLLNEKPSQVAIMTYDMTGLSTVTYDDMSSNVTVSQNNGIWQIQTANGTDSLAHVERLQLTDQSYAYDLSSTQSAGEAADLISAVFGSNTLANKELVGNWIHFFDAGGTPIQAAQDLIAANVISTNPTVFLSTLWQNVTGSTIPASDLSKFELALQSGTFSEASLLVYAASLPQNQSNANLQGLTQTGLAFIPTTTHQGITTTAFSGMAADYVVTDTGSGSITVNQGGNTTPLLNVQRITFSDSALAFDLGIHQSAGQAAELIGAAYGGSALSNKTLVGTTLALLDAGNSLQQVATTLLANLSFTSPNDFVPTVWKNVTNTDITTTELTTLTNLINAGSVSEAQLLATAATSSTNQSQINLAGILTHGLAYIAA